MIHMWKKSLVTSSFSYSHNVFLLFPKHVFQIFSHIILLSANAFNLDTSRNLSFGEGLDDELIVSG